ncbi:MAG: energy-coupling factor transporter ATPase [Clostridia bacterium]|nr:energy-coupling factor transporter ATPase [Clostridia bacterium]
MQIIELRNVSYEYPIDSENGIMALDNVSLSIEEGQFVVLCGANGSGKSTLAKLLNGLILPTKGSVFVYGANTVTQDDSDIYKIRSKVGMVFQNPDNQMIASIIEDDIAFGPENLGVPREEIIKRVEWALSVVGMSAMRKHTPFKLSGGQKQRIAIAAVLAMRPSVLVFDESTAMLDPKGRAEVMQVIHSLNKEQNITVIHITHHMEECIGADRVIVMKEGRLVFDDKPEVLFRQYDFAKDCKLELPVIAYITHLLGQRGIVMPEVQTEEEFAEALCRLL